MGGLEESRELLLDSLAGGPVQFYRPGGNTGDRLIDAGTMQLLRDGGVKLDPKAELTVVGGCGGWSHTYHSMPARVSALEGPVVVFPSTFQISEPSVCRFLLDTDATIFARERRSYHDACFAKRGAGVKLAHCPSFFFDYRRWQGRRGKGVLLAFRADKESAGRPVPVRNRDISREFGLREWLDCIAAHAEVHTDRAHVMIAAALLGKRVRFRDGSYFKVRALAETWLGAYDVEPLA